MGRTFHEDCAAAGLSPRPCSRSEAIARSCAHDGLLRGSSPPATREGVVGRPEPKSLRGNHLRRTGERTRSLGARRPAGHQDRGSDGPAFTQRRSEQQVGHVAGHLARNQRVVGGGIEAVAIVPHRRGNDIDVGVNPILSPRPAGRLDHPERLRIHPAVGVNHEGHCHGDLPVGPGGGTPELGTCRGDPTHQLSHPVEPAPERGCFVPHGATVARRTRDQPRPASFDSPRSECRCRPASALTVELGHRVGLVVYRGLGRY
jgi:hypothetical protein